VLAAIAMQHFNQDQALVPEEKSRLLSVEEES